VREVDLVRWGDDRLRVAAWRGDRDLAYLAPVADAQPPTTDAVRHCLDLLTARGFRSVVTAALNVREVQGFLGAGFTVRERLHLLTCRLDVLPESPRAPLRRARRGDRASVLAVDERAFPPFWRLDEAALDEALHATPTARFRVADDGAVVGYAISGRAGKRGYLQRLAVDPAQQGHGLGTALVVDGLRWMRRWGAAEAFVNTQESNDHALALYERLGFRRQPSGLAVLETGLG
jgi:ribosomal protein S18 acetylase RimI-like enzyme